MPLPYQCAGLATEAAEAAMQRALNNAIMVFNWLHLGSPAKVPVGYVASTQLSGEQWAVVRRLRRMMQEWKEADPVTAEAMGWSAGKVESLESQVAVLTKIAEDCVLTFGSGQKPLKPKKPKGEKSLFSEVQLAKDIVADRIAFSGAPSFDPSPLLEPATREMYDKPLDYALAPDDGFEPPPRVQVRGKRQEVIKLLKALDATGRLKDEVRWSHRAGLFALPKSATHDRMIMDSRPANQLEPALNAWTQTMGAVAPLLDLQLQPDECIVASGEDLKDYYYYFKISPQRTRRNAISMSFTRAEAQQFKAFSEVECSTADIFVPALNTMAMGDVNAVEFGQQAHAVLALSTGLHLSDLLTLRGTAPRQAWAVGLVIDDFVIVEKVPIAEPSAGLSAMIADNMVEAYEIAGLVPNQKKRFRDDARPKFWGISLDGEAGIIRAQLERALPIAFITARVARTGLASRKLLEVLAGAWTAILQCRRRGMCLLEAIFEEIQAHSYEEEFQLSSAAVDELWSLVVLCPFFCTDLRAAASTEFSLVDASGEWKAEVTTNISSVLASELVRHKLTKAAWSRLLSPWRALQRLHGTLRPADEVPEGEMPLNAHPLWTAIARHSQFSTVWRQRVKGRTHINVSELDAYLRAETRKGRTSPSSRPMIGSDSQVTLGAIVKGRSFSPVLNKQLKKALPDVIGFNVFSIAQYIGTAENVADDPTRDRDCRAPVTPCPNWFAAAAKGEFYELDAFLAEQSLAAADLARLPEEFNRASLPVPSVSERKLKRRKFMELKTKRTKGKDRVASVKPPVARARPMPWMPRRRLTAAAAEALAVIPTSQFVLPSGFTWEEVGNLQGHLDLFSGSRGAARAVANKTGRWVLCYDLKHAARENLLDESIRTEVEAVLLAGCFTTLTAGPVCASFSRAVCPAVRSKEFPLGLADLTDNMRAKVAEGNSFATWVARLLTLALDRAMVVWVENPAGSFFWQHPKIAEVMKQFSLDFFTTDFCRWGTPWRKRTRFLGNFLAAGQKCLLLQALAHSVTRL